MEKHVLQSNAIDALKEGKELIAQQRFREEARKNPCCETWNNLGVYYWVYGMHFPDGKIARAEKIGMRYLQRAAQHEANSHAYVSLASAQCEQGCFQDAYANFSKAYEQKKDGMIAYNLGGCLYRLKDYSNAIHFLEVVKQRADLRQVLANGGQHPLIVMAYCKLKLGDFKACLKCLSDYREAFPEDEMMDVFVLRFLCGRYKDAMFECAKLLQEWYATDYLCAMVAECLCKMPEYRVDKLSEHTDRVQEIIKLIDNKKLREELIKKYQYVPPIIGMYQFIEKTKAD